MKIKYINILLTFLIVSFQVYPEPGREEASAFKSFKSSLTTKKEFSMDCQLASFFPGKEPIVHKYKVFVKEEKTLLITLEPERDKGKKILMVKNQLWQYFPRIEKTININTAVALYGNVNVTDIISSSVFQFYDKTGYEYQKSDKTHIFQFTAKDKSAPYGKIRYFFQEGKVRYFEVYARSGVMLKKIYFLKYLENKDGFSYPSDIKVVNTLKDGEYSLVRMSNMRNQRIPEYYFNPSTLNKVRE